MTTQYCLPLYQVTHNKYLIWVKSGLVNAMYLLRVVWFVQHFFTEKMTWKKIPLFSCKEQRGNFRDIQDVRC